MASLAPAPGSANPDLYRELAVELWGIERQMTRGCGNHGCRVWRTVGQGTNASCSCGPRMLARRLRDIADRLSPNDKVSDASDAFAAPLGWAVRPENVETEKQKT